MIDFQAYLKESRVIPVLKLNEEDETIAIAEALVLGGAKALEITLRTPRALDMISLLRQRFPDTLVGAGTVINGLTLGLAVDAGSQFIVSPGLTSALAQAAQEKAVPFLPGVATASEIMTGLDAGLNLFKFFPAEISGGIPALKAFKGPFSDVSFCPTGGISAATVEDYLNLPNVVCVGGSWMVDDNLVQSRNWHAIQKRMAAALETRADLT